MSVVSNNILAGASGQGGGYEIERSLRFNSGDSAYLNRTPSAAGNRKTWTWSGWVKRSAITDAGEYLFWTASGNDYTGFHFNGSDDNLVFAADSGSGSLEVNCQTNAKFRDPSAWYHFVVSVDTTQSTSADRVKIYVNGTLQTLSTAVYPSQDYQFRINTTNEHRLASRPDRTTYLDAYLADVHFIDGQALAPTDFGETDDNGVWQPKKFVGTYTTHTVPVYNSTYGSDITSTEVAKTIDGDIATYGVPTGDFVGYTYSNTNDPIINIKWENTKGSAITVYIQPWVSGGAANAGTFASSGANSVTIAAGATLETTFTFPAGYDGYFRIYASGDGTNLRIYDVGGVARTFNSFYLPFSDNSSNAALGTDTSGNNNDWTVNNLEAAPGVGVPVSGATGALPIYNTTDTYGAVKGTGTRTDPNSSYLSLAVAMDGANGGTAFTDESATIKGSGTAKTVTAGGATTQTTTSKFYGSSGSFTGNTANMSFSSSSDFAFGTGDFTIEMWLNLSGTNVTLWDTGSVNGNGNLAIFGSTTGLYIRSKPNTDLFVTNTGLTLNTWHHLVVTKESGVLKLYVDGQLKGSQANNTDINQTSVNIGVLNGFSGSYNLNGYMQGLRAYKGLAKYTSNFTVVAPANATLQVGIDSLVDTPTNGTQTDTGAGGEVTGNYCTWNPLASTGTLSDGNLNSVFPASGGGNTFGTIAMPSSGKYYWEITVKTSNSKVAIGFCDPYVNATYIVNNVGIYYASFGGKIYPTGTTAGVTYGAGYTLNDVIGVAANCDDDTIIFYKNGVSQGVFDPKTYGLTIIGQVPAAGDASGNYGDEINANFGQRPFAYTAPSGYKCLCTTNLPEPTIADGSKYFDVVTYPGASGDTSITSLSFQPEFVWIKNRSASNNHLLFDAIRGATEMLRSDTTDAESVNTNTLKSFDSNGFTVGDNAKTGASGSNYVGWAWDAGSSNTTIAAGGLNSSVYDQSQNWAANTIYSTPTVTGTIYSMWDGDTSTRNGSGGSESYETTFSPTLSGTVRVYAYSSGQRFRVNDGLASEETITATGSGWHSFSTNFTSISTVGFVSTAGTGYATYAWEIGGKIMIDPSISITNNVPSIASTVRANPTAGFSIISWTGSANATVGHGLNAAPKFLITKRRAASTSWRPWSAEFSNIASNYLGFDNSAVGTFGGTYWGSMTSTTIGLAGLLDNNNGDMIAYCFAPVEGYSAMGSYTGNGSADGPFVYTGFKVAFLILKQTDATGNWSMYDAGRDNRLPLYPNLSNSEGTLQAVSFLSNGFKLDVSTAFVNASSGTYLYLAFAEHPFKTARAR